MTLKTGVVKVGQRDLTINGKHLSYVSQRPLPPLCLLYVSAKKLCPSCFLTTDTEKWISTVTKSFNHVGRFMPQTTIVRRSSLSLFWKIQTAVQDFLEPTMTADQSGSHFVVQKWMFQHCWISTMCVSSTWPVWFLEDLQSGCMWPSRSLRPV